YDFNGEVYDKEIVVELLAFKRAEAKFDSIPALKNQMRKDIAEGAVYHGIQCMP
ncbi:MAG: riboflavin kinase, partial [Lachnospiraceae bacterium]|nr:riboflavin kinase [Lachnospiraceae bacterium]